MQADVGTEEAVSGEAVARAALRALFEERYGQLVALAQVSVGDRATAEEVVQDAFAAAIGRAATLRADVAGYVVQSVVHGSRSRLRRRAVERRPRPDIFVRVAPSEGDSELFDLVRRLPTRQAQAIVCRFVLDLPHAEVAACLGISTTAAKTHVRRGMHTLKIWIEEDPQ